MYIPKPDSNPNLATPLYSVQVAGGTDLAHEVGDDPVESGALVAESLLSGAQSTEVLRGLRHNIRAQLIKKKAIR
jgi:hypothetical protein